MGIPGFSGFAADVLEDFGQPVRIRLDMAADPVVVREVTGFFRDVTVPAALFNRPQQPRGPLVQVDVDDTAGIVIERCEIDISILVADPAGPVVIAGERYTVTGWVTYVIAGGADEAVDVDGIFVTYRLHRKL